MPTNYPLHGTGWSLHRARHTEGEVTTYRVDFPKPSVLLSENFSWTMFNDAVDGRNTQFTPDVWHPYNLRVTPYYAHPSTGVRSVERDAVNRARIALHDATTREFVTNLPEVVFIFWCRHYLHMPLTHIASLLGGTESASQVGARYTRTCTQWRVVPYRSRAQRQASQRSVTTSNRDTESLSDIPTYLTDEVQAWLDDQNLTFGNELEISGMGTSTAVRTIRMLGDVPVSTDTSYRHTVLAEWKAVTDASVSRGCEVVSPVLHGAAGFMQLRRVMLALKTDGARITRSCGGHVHFGMETRADGSAISPAHRARVIHAHSRWQGMFDAFVARDRLSNTFCRPRSETSADMLAESMANGDPRGQTPVGHDRYMNLNLLSWVKYGTFEMRQHEGCLNPKKMLAWMCLNMAFINACQENDSPYDRSAVCITQQPPTQPQEMLDVLARLSNMPESIKALIGSFIR